VTDERSADNSAVDLTVPLAGDRQWTSLLGPGRRRVPKSAPDQGPRARAGSGPAVATCSLVQSRLTGTVQFRQRSSGEDGTASDGAAFVWLRRSTRKIAQSATVVMRPEMITDASGKSASEVPTR
jgi:hypothetical protein